MGHSERSEGVLLVEKYRLLELIGSGGMGEVYRAENTKIRRIVAVKLLQPTQTADRELTARLLAEAQTVGAIRHPAIVDVLDAGVSDQGPFVVMEYLIGQSAARVLSTVQTLSLDAALATVLPVLEGLDAAHRAGVVHRDLKPENIFYSVSDAEGLKVKLLDFGIAKVLAPADGWPQTATGVVFGTPDYMSPEQANGELHVNPRSDLFSVGVVLFELLTGKRPFRGASAVATAYKISHAKTPSIAENGGPSDSRLEAILQRALRKRPEERYGSAQEMADELRTLDARVDGGTARLVELVGKGSPYRQEVGKTGATSAAVRKSAPVEPRRSDPLAGSGLGGGPLSRDAFSTTERRRSAEHRTPSFPSSDAASARPRRVDPSEPPRVRGVVLRAIDAFVRERMPDAKRTALLERLSQDQRRDFVYETLQSIVQYDVEVLTAYLDAATEQLGADGPVLWRRAGVTAIDGELAPLLKSATQPALPPKLVRRVSAICERFFSFGSWDSSQEGERLVTLRIRDFEAASLPLRMWILGVLEGAAARHATPLRVVCARGEVAFAPELVVDFSW